MLLLFQLMHIHGLIHQWHSMMVRCMVVVSFLSCPASFVYSAVTGVAGVFGVVGCLCFSFESKFMSLVTVRLDMNVQWAYAWQFPEAHFPAATIDL